MDVGFLGLFESFDFSREYFGDEYLNYGILFNGMRSDEGQQKSYQESGVGFVVVGIGYYS